MRAMAGRPGPHAALPRRRERQVVLPEAGARSGAPDWLQTTVVEHAQRHDVQRPRGRRPRPRRLGGQPGLPRLPRLAVPRATTPTTPTSCASTSTRSPGVAFDHVREAAERGARRSSTSSASRPTPRRPATAASTSTCGCGPHGTLRGAGLRGGGGPRAGAPPPRPDHRGVVEGGAGRAGLHRLQPERAAQDGLRRLVGPGTGRRPGVHPLFWDELATVQPDELTIATVPARLAERGDPWADMPDRPQSLEPLLALHEADMAAGLMDAPWPPVYPKQPNEPPRVAPSRARQDDG